MFRRSLVNIYDICILNVFWTSLRKKFLALCFIFKENVLFCFLSETIVFSVSVFCSQILKLNLWPKVSLIYATSIVKRPFGIFI